jgi:hypothetical protein
VDDVGRVEEDFLDLLALLAAETRDPVATFGFGPRALAGALRVASAAAAPSGAQMRRCSSMSS